MPDKSVSDWTGPFTHPDAVYGKVYVHGDDTVETVEFSVTGAELKRYPGKPRMSTAAPPPTKAR